MPLSSVVRIVDVERNGLAGRIQLRLWDPVGVAHDHIRRRAVDYRLLVVANS